LIYQDVDAMKRVVRALNPDLDGFEASCFDGQYIAGKVSAAEFAAIESQRSQARREGEEGAEDRSRLSLQSATEQG
jgi:amidophosphoribosyltransferase